MNKKLSMLLWLGLLALPRQGWAIDDCFQCVLGIWDDPGLTRNVGEIVAGQPKDIYIGIKYAEGFQEAVAVEFSIAGLGPILVAGVETIVPTAIACGYVGAPADTSAGSTHGGGCHFAWPGCLAGNQPLLRVTLLFFSGDITNGLLQVKRKYPPSEPGVRTPLIYQCDRPTYTPTRVQGGYYILNWNGDPTVGLDRAPWSTVKQLYR